MMLCFLESQNINKYNLNPIFECIDKNILKYYKKLKWNKFSHSHFFSGILNCHPLYGDKMNDLLLSKC
jgi:hypothetical protein